jgi:uncharacterized protein (TIGR03435 family)
VLREDDGRIYYSRITLRRLMARAYGLKNYQLVWPHEPHERDVYEISATTPDGATKKEIPEMLKALLAERFRLVAHLETREVLGYELVVGKGGLRSKALSLPAGVKPLGCRLTIEGDLYRAQSQTLGAFASCLSVGDRPLFDATAMEGTFDLDIEFSGTSTAALPATTEGDGVLGAEAQPIATALRGIGLNIVPARKMLPHLVVDGVDAVPTEN